MSHRAAARPFSVALIAALAIALLPAAAARPALAASPNIVISEVYGGGGNSGATLTNDFIELFNRGTSTVNLSGWSVQYASATGTGNFTATALSGSVAPGQSYLVQEAAGTGGTTPLPTPDALGSIAMSGTAGKVIVANTASSLACNGGSTPCDASQLAQIVDLVGYGGANFFEGSAAAPSLSNTTSAGRTDRCSDTDVNSADFASGAPDPQNTVSPISACSSGDQAPSVSSTTPADGAIAVAVDSDITVNFSEPVDVAGTWYTIACATSGSHAADVSGGPSAFTLDPTADFASGELCNVTISAAGVSDRDTDDPPDGMAADYVFSFTAATSCGDPATLLHDIQGSGASSPVIGSVVEIEGVVVGDYQASTSFNGFHVQEEDVDADADPTTSEGIFVFEGGSTVEVDTGDVVRVAGTVGEFSSSGSLLTQLTSITRVLVCSAGNPLPTAATVTMPFDSTTFPERFEGMRAAFSQTLTVSEVFTLARFGEAVLSSGGRLIQPTEVAAPGAAANALQAVNDRNRIVLDDGDNRQNIDPTLYPQGGLSAANTLRVGDTLAGGTFVLEQRFGVYRLQPIDAVAFTHNNARTTAPEPVGGDLRVASFNVLNYFNGDGLGGGFPTSRGAETQFEFDRQRDKIISALVAIDADIVGLMEIENDGSASTSAIADLVDGLNDATSPGRYAYISTGVVGTDEIVVALIYQPAAATPVGDPAILDSTVDPRFIDTSNRPTIAQTFDTVTDGRLTVAVNHLKSKGSDCNALGDPDMGDGQGNCNLTRLAAAQAEVDWLASDPTGSGDRDVLVIGDLNSYYREDPVQAFLDAGYTSMPKLFGGQSSYSYVFQGQTGTLDHALASPTLTAQVTGANEWHINPDEPVGLDYNTNFKTAGQVVSFYAADPYRSSDHDPALVGADLLAYQFGGFRPPVNGSAPNIVKAGSSLPLKFSLGGDHGLAVLAGGPTFQREDCTSGVPSGAPLAAIADEPFSYDAGSDMYRFVWKTQKAWAGWCGTLTVALADGTWHDLEVIFRS